MTWGAIIGLVVFVLGVIALWQRHGRLATLALGPLVLAMVASSLEKGPIYGRLMLFYVPMLALGLGEGAQWAMSCSKRIWLQTATAVAITASLATPVWSSASGFLQPRAISDVRPVLEHVSRQIQSGDVLYMFRFALPAMAFYGPRMGLNSVPLSAPALHGDSEVDNLASIPDGTRVWFVMAGVPISRVDYHREEEQILRALSRRRPRLAEFRATGAVIYLYQLGSQVAAERTSSGTDAAITPSYSGVLHLSPAPEGQGAQHTMANDLRR